MDKITVDSSFFIKDSFHRFVSEQEKHFQDDGKAIEDSLFEEFTETIVIPYKEKIPPLFRYSSADYYNIRNLETETLLLSNIGNMNDIFEGLSGEVDAGIIDSLSELNDIAFIKSFTELKNDFLMWSHYGEQFSGMCVEYDFSKLDDKILYHLFPVVYSEERYKLKTLASAVTELYELKKANEEECYPDLYESLLDIMALFLRKPSSWKNEKEWRLVATYPQIYNNPEDFYENGQAVEMPLYALNDKIISVKNCIKAVYIGPRMENVKRNHIKEICEKLKDVSVHELSVSKTDYALE